MWKRDWIRVKEYQLIVYSNNFDSSIRWDFNDSSESSDSSDNSSNNEIGDTNDSI